MLVKFLCVALALGLTGAAASAQTAPVRYVTTDGVALVLPAIVALDCPTMRAKLDEIYASGYRDGSPQPKDQADMALLDYENRLSGAYFTRCLRNDARTAAPESAFVNGFTTAADE